MQKFLRLAAFTLSFLAIPAAAFAQGDPYALKAPVGAAITVKNPTLYQITPQMKGAKCDGTTDDYAAFAAADAISAIQGPMYIGGGTCVIGTNIVLSHPLVLASGGVLKPKSGVTVTLNGSYQAGPYQTFDTSAGGSVIAGTHFNGLSVYAENFGTGQGNPTLDQAGMTAAIAFVQGVPHGITINLASSQGYSMAGGFVIAPTSTAQAVRIVGQSQLNCIHHTGNTTLFTFKGLPGVTPQHAMGAGFDHLCIVGSNNPALTNSVAAQFSDSFGFDIHSDQFADYPSTYDVVIKNDVGFTEGFKAYENVHVNSRYCYFVTRNPLSSSSSMRSLDIEGNVSCSLGNDASGKACFGFDASGADISVYSYNVDIICTPPSGAGNYHYIAVQAPGALNKINQLQSGRITIHADSVSTNIGTDGNLLWASNRDADSLGRGQIVDTDVQLLGTNPQTLDLSSGAAPAIVPLYQELVYGQDNAGSCVISREGRPGVDARGVKMTVLSNIVANRASYPYQPGCLPGNSTLRLNISGVMNSSPCSSSYIISTRGSGNNSAVQLDSNGGIVCSGVSVAGAAGPGLTITIDNSAYGTDGQLVMSIQGLGQ